MTRPINKAQRHTALTLIVSLAAAISLMTACGDSGITGENVPQMRFNSQQSNIQGEGGLDLSQGQRDRQGEPVSIVIESFGEAPLEVQSISMSSDTPDAISYVGEITGSGCMFTRDSPNNDGGSTCKTEEEFCDDREAQCRDATIPETPFTLEPDATREIEFLRLALPEGQALDCPEGGEIPDGVPSSLRENYCGTLTVKSDAKIATDFVNENGNAKLYFQADPGSGQIEIDDADFSWTGVTPGDSVSDQFNLTNVGGGPLTIENMRIVQTDFAGSFEITTRGNPVSFPVELPSAAEGGNTQDFTLTFNAPDSAMESELNFQAFLEIQSSSIEQLPDQAINVSTQVEIGPVARFSPRAFSFSDSNSKTLTISNEGTSNLRLNSLSFVPADAKDHYTVLNDGTDVCSGGACNFTSNRVIQAEGSKQLTVEYSPGSFDDRVVTLKINHSDPLFDGYQANQATNDDAEIKLLGTQDGGVGRVNPLILNFGEGGDSPRSLGFVARNLGTSAFTTDKFRWLPDPMNPPVEFFVSRGLMRNSSQQINQQNPVTLDPGTLFVGSVNYDPTTSGSDESQFSVEFHGSDNLGYNPENATCGNAGVKLCINKNPVQPRPTITPKITPSSSDGPIQMKVYESMQLSAADSTTSASSLFYQWMTLERPADSHMFINPEATNVESLTIRPDRPGTYKIGLHTYTTTSTAQETVTIEAMAR